MVSVAFLTIFCSEKEPSLQVVWLWKSPATYLPAVTAVAGAGARLAAVASAAATANAIFVVDVFTCVFPNI